MVSRRFALIYLLLLWWLTCGLCNCTVYFMVWSYPNGKHIDPSAVTITLSQGTIIDKGITTTGGSVFFRTPNDIACYTVTITAPGLIYQKQERSQCPRTFLPGVVRGE